MMTEEILNPETTGLNVNESMKAELLTSAKWAKFLCIVGCVFVGIFVLIGLVAVFATSAMSEMFGFKWGGALFGIIYLAISALYIYPLIKGFQFANCSKAACITNDQQQLARSFEGMKSVLRYMGILTIICLCFYIMMLIPALIFGGMAAFF
jgi:hypothetical protein